VKGKSSVPKCQMGLLHFTSASYLLRNVLSLLPLKSHFCLALDLACLGRSVPQLIAGMSSLCPSNPCIETRESRQVFTDKPKTLRASLVIEL